MKNKVSKSLIPAVAIIAILILAVGFTFFSISNSFKDLSAELNSSQAEVLLASSELSTNSLTSIPIKYYPQAKDDCVNLYNQSLKNDLENRQFEWSECGYYNDAFEQNLVQATLSENGIPVPTNQGEDLPNRGIKTANFLRWFDETNSISSTLALQYSANKKTFSFESDNFQPVSSKLFTMNLEVPFVALLSGSETFSITADDDTWVFLDDSLVLDLGGIHSAMEANLFIHSDGKVFVSINGEKEYYSGIKLGSNQNAKINIFHANRDSNESIFKLTFSDMYLNIFNTEIAYNENGDAYVQPLGESSVFEPNYSGSILTSIIAQFFILGILLILTPAVVSFAIRRQK